MTLHSTSATFSALSLLAHLGASQSAFAQAAPAAGPFTTACNAALAADIQEGRRLCVVGIVQDGTKVDVFMSNKSEAVFKTVQVYKSPPQAPMEDPIPGLDGRKGQIVAIGGFDNGATIYSARILVPRQ